MSKNRVMKLYRIDMYYGSPVRRYVTQQPYEYVTKALEQQHADDLAKKHNLRNGEGYVIVYDEQNNILDRLEIPY